MIRKPRYPLTLRLAWMESELGHAATLAREITRDVLAMRFALDEAETRIVILTGVVVAALIPLGIDPGLLDALLEHMSPDGDVEEAEEVGAAILQQVVLSMAPTEGEGH